MTDFFSSLEQTMFLIWPFLFMNLLQPACAEYLTFGDNKLKCSVSWVTARTVTPHLPAVILLS